MHNFRSYQDNLELASVLYSHAMRSMGCSPDQGLGYCVDEVQPERREDELVRILLYAAILRTGLRLGISPLSGQDPFAAEFREEIEACWAGLSRGHLASLGASPSDIEALTKDLGLICRELELSSVSLGAF